MTLKVELKHLQREARARTVLGGYASWMFDADHALLGISERGVASILVVVDQEQTPGLPPAIFLPVRWVRDGSAHHASLPKSLCVIADDVLKELGGDFKGWWLAPLNEELAKIDLSDLPLEGSSGTVSLAASLVVAAAGGRSSAHVFASIGWEHGLLSKVEGVAAKVGLLNKVAPANLFVHERDYDTAAAAAGAGLTVEAIKMHPRGVRVGLLPQISSLLSELGVRPSRRFDSPFPDRLSAYNQPDAWPSPEARDEYFDNEIRPEYAPLVRRSASPPIIEKRPFVILFNFGNLSLCKLLLAFTEPSSVIAIRQQDPANDSRDHSAATRLLSGAGLSKEQFSVEAINADDEADIAAKIAQIVERLNGLSDKGYVDAQGANSFLKSVGFVIAQRTGFTPIALEQVWIGRSRTLASSPKLQQFRFVLPP